MASLPRSLNRTPKPSRAHLLGPGSSPHNQPPPPSPSSPQPPAPSPSPSPHQPGQPPSPAQPPRPPPPQLQPSPTAPLLPSWRCIGRGCSPTYPGCCSICTQVRPEEISAWLQSYWWGDPVEAWCAADHVKTTVDHLHRRLVAEAANLCVSEATDPMHPRLQSYAHLRCAVDDRLLLSERGGARLEGHFVHVHTQLPQPNPNPDPQPTSTPAPAPTLQPLTRPGVS